MLQILSMLVDIGLVIYQFLFVKVIYSIYSNEIAYALIVTIEIIAFILINLIIETFVCVNKNIYIYTNINICNECVLLAQTLKSSPIVSIPTPIINPSSSHNKPSTNSNRKIPISSDNVPKYSQSIVSSEIPNCIKEISIILWYITYIQFNRSIGSCKYPTMCALINKGNYKQHSNMSVFIYINLLITVILNALSNLILDAKFIIIEKHQFTSLVKMIVLYPYVIYICDKRI